MAQNDQDLKFKEWIKEMVGTGAIYDPSVKPVGFQWWGCPEIYNKKKKRKKKKK